jgi:hypothetical protein
MKSLPHASIYVFGNFQCCISIDDCVEHIYSSCCRPPVYISEDTILAAFCTLAIVIYKLLLLPPYIYRRWTFCFVLLARFSAIKRPYCVCKNRATLCLCLPILTYVCPASGLKSNFLLLRDIHAILYDCCVAVYICSGSSYTQTAFPQERRGEGDSW